MDRREFPVLSSAEETHVEQLAVGLGDTASRVVVYLCRRSVEDDIEPAAATEMAIRIGTGSSRKAIQDAIKTLEKRDLIEPAEVQTERPGRPPNAWRITRPFPDVVDQAYNQHATQLIELGESIYTGEYIRSSSEQETDPDRCITVGLNWHPNELQLPLFAARKDGQYSDRGVTVEWQAFSGSRRSLEAVLSGEVAVGIAGAATVTRARASGEPIVPVAALFQRPMVVLYTTRDLFGEQLSAVEQLRGCKVGMPVSSETGVLSRLFLAQAGVLKDVEIIDLHGEEHEALASGDVDVVTGIFSDPLRLESASTTIDSIRVADRYPIYGPTIITTETVLRQKRNTVASFLAGTTAGWASANQAPQEVCEHIADETNRTPEWMADIFERAASEFGETEEVAQHGWGWQTSETWNRLETALAQTDLLDTRHDNS